MSKKVSLAQRAKFYKFEPGTNLKEREKLSGPQFDVFESELKAQQRKAHRIKGLALDSDQKIRMDNILERKFIREQSCYLADYDLGGL